MKRASVDGSESPSKRMWTVRACRGGVRKEWKQGDTSNGGVSNESNTTNQRERSDRRLLMRTARYSSRRIIFAGHSIFNSRSFPRVMLAGRMEDISSIGQQMDSLRKSSPKASLPAVTRERSFGCP